MQETKVLCSDLVMLLSTGMSTRGRGGGRATRKEASFFLPLCQLQQARQVSSRGCWRKEWRRMREEEAEREREGFACLSSDLPCETGSEKAWEEDKPSRGRSGLSLCPLPRPPKSSHSNWQGSVPEKGSRLKDTERLNLNQNE